MNDDAHIRLTLSQALWSQVLWRKSVQPFGKSSAYFGVEKAFKWSSQDATVIVAMLFVLFPADLRALIC